MKKNIVFILFISFWLHAAEQRAPALASSASQAATATDILAQLNGNSPEAQEQIIALKKVFGHVAHRHRTELTPFKKLSIPQTIQESHAEDDPSADDEKNQGALQDYASIAIPMKILANGPMPDAWSTHFSCLLCRKNSAINLITALARLLKKQKAIRFHWQSLKQHQAITCNNQRPHSPVATPCYVSYYKARETYYYVATAHTFSAIQNKQKKVR